MIELLKKLVGDKKEYRQMMARVKALPEEYQYVYEKMQHYMWNFCIGDGLDVLQIQYDLIDLFEAGASDGKHILEITGEDVASFCDELLRGVKTHGESLRRGLNRDIQKKLNKA